MTQLATFELKKGATLQIVCQLTDTNGAGIDLTSAQVSSKMVSLDGAQTVNFAVVKAADQTANAGTFTLTAQTASTTKPAYIGDVKIEVGGTVTYSETFRVEIKPAITG